MTALVAPEALENVPPAVERPHLSVVYGRQAAARPWWRSASIYQIYVRSFCDSNGDGVGDLGGVLGKLHHVASLGVDAIWLTPFFESPMVDGGYDVADYRSVDPRFGDHETVDRIIEEAHGLGMRVMIEVVPNHVSSSHQWFKNAVSDPTHKDRSKFHFRDPSPVGGTPNNWRSAFGGPAWSLEPSGRQYYLHLFSREQPDLNWEDPEVRADFEQTLRFWLDRGIDGFRVDVAHGLFKDPLYRDNPELPREVRGGLAQGDGERHCWNLPEVHEVYRGWRRILDSYTGERAMLGEVGVVDREQLALYVRPDEFPLAYEFEFIHTEWDAVATKETVSRLLRALDAVGAPATWVLSNHDVLRAVTRYGGGEQGLRRARAKALLAMALPGAMIIYNGDELGLEDIDVPEEALSDPIALVAGVPGRDGSRAPIPWSSEGPAFGFSEAGSWLPVPDGWGGRSAVLQERDPFSTLWLYRLALSIRRLPALCAGDMRWLDAPEGVLAFERRYGKQRIHCIVNFSARPIVMQQGDVLLSSSLRPIGGVLEPDTACWVMAPSGDT